MQFDNLVIGSEPTGTSYKLAGLPNEQRSSYIKFLQAKYVSYEQGEAIALEFDIDPDTLLDFRNIFREFLASSTDDLDKIQQLANILGVDMYELIKLKNEYNITNLDLHQRGILNHILVSGKATEAECEYLCLSPQTINDLIQEYHSRVNEYNYAQEQLLLDPISLALVPAKPEVQIFRDKSLSTHDFISFEDDKIDVDSSSQRTIMQTLRKALDLTTETQNLNETGRAAKFIFMLRTINAFAAAAFRPENLRPGIETVQGNRIEEIICAEVLRKYFHYLGVKFSNRSLVDKFIELVSYNNLSDASIVLQQLIQTDYSTVYAKFFLEPQLWGEGIRNAVMAEAEMNKIPDIVTRPVYLVISLFLDALAKTELEQEG